LPGKRKTGPGGGLAARYGTAPRRRYIEILARMRRLHECPRCQVRAARRLSVGLWQCGRCGHQFTGGAYMPFTKLGDLAKRSATGTTYSTPATGAPKAPTDVGTLKGEFGKPRRRPRRKKAESESPKEEAQ